MDSRRPLRFGGFRFDPATGELTRPDGSRRRLQPQPAAILALIVAREGDLVTRAELQAAVWPDTKVEFDQGINFCIRQIRAALGDSAENPGLIETLPRRGYRLLVPLQHERDPLPSLSRAKRSTGVRPILFGAAVLVITAAVAWAGLRSDAFAPPVGGEEVRIAVLPLDDSAGRPSELSRSLEESLVLELMAAGGGAFTVIGPLTTVPLSAAGTTPAEIATRLDADYLVSGDVQRGDSTVFLQVVRSSDGAHVLARRSDLRAQAPAEIAAALTSQLLATLGAGSARTPSLSSPAGPA
jgi:DNA-binding winged helix-turn-helix (wHTH) protein/TolB-like protein